MHDITIIGTGIVGLINALLLAQNTRLQILVMDAKSYTPSWQLEHYDTRVYAITPATQKALKNINAWQDLVAKRISCFKYMEVWDSAGSGRIRFNHQELNVAELGFIVEENLIRSILHEKIKTKPNIELKSPIILERLQEYPDYIELSCQGLPSIKTKLLIGADGAHSWVRDAAGIPIKTYDYQHTALIAHVHTEMPHQMTAWQCFVSSEKYPLGPLAFLPLADACQSSIVWSIAPEKAEELLKLDDGSFCEIVAQAFGHRLGKVTQVSKRHSFPLYERRAGHYIKNRIALIGDAIHTIHPLAGQGVNLGVGDAACLAEVIKQALQKGRDYASYHTLRSYERERKRNNVLMLATVRLLKCLFESKKQTVKLMRNHGLNIANSAALLKNLFASQAMSS